MIKNRYLSEKQKAIGVIIIFFIPIFVMIYINGKNRKEQLANNSLMTIGVIEKLVESTSKGVSTRVDVVYFYFVQNDTVFHKIEDFSEGYIEQRELKINDCFETKIVKPNYVVFDIDFNKRVDTTINKNAYRIHKYNSSRHEDFISER